MLIKALRIGTGCRKRTDAVEGEGKAISDKIHQLVSTHTGKQVAAKRSRGISTFSFVTIFTPIAEEGNGKCSGISGRKAKMSNKFVQVPTTMDYKTGY